MSQRNDVDAKAVYFESELASARDVVAWPHDTLPTSAITRAVVHHDETEPHVHVYLRAAPPSR